MRYRSKSANLLLAIAILVGSFSPVLVRANETASVTDQALSGYNIDQLQALINKLQARLNELKKGTQCFVTDSELSFGDGEGVEIDQVRRLQDFLREKGHLKIKSTGWFGKLTKTALVAFQKANGLPETGDFDAATKAKAHSLNCTTLTKIKAKVEAPKKEQPKPETGSTGVSSINMSVNGSNVSWNETGYAKNGFKIVWSKNPSPTYPTRDGDKYIYLGEPTASSTTIDAFDGSGTYYVRVCEYLGGACGTYSNQEVTQL
jgi:hypothetical protein